MLAWLTITLQMLCSSTHPYFPQTPFPLTPHATFQVGEGGTIFVVIDALRPDHLSPYGAQHRGTPYLSQLSQEGLTFLQHRANTNWTRPSIASMMTGLLPYQHRVERDHDRLPQDTPTLAEMLQRHGIATGAVVGNGNAGRVFGFQRGFDWYADTVSHWDGLPNADAIVDLAVDYIQKHQHEKYFLWLFFVDPHDPYHAPSPYEMMFVQDPWVPLIRTPHWEAKTYPAPLVQRMKQTYNGAIAYTDRAIGRLLQHLENLQLAEQTTIVVTSDHGEAFGEHGAYLHAHHLYEEHVRIPLIVRAPHMSHRGVAVDHVSQSIDLMPTFLDMFALEQPSHLPGVSLKQLIGSSVEASQGRSVISEFNNFGIHRRSVVLNQRKIIQYMPASYREFMSTVKNPALLPSVQFHQTKWYAYNLQQDPFERKSLYHPQLFEQEDWRLAAQVLRQLPECGSLSQDPNQGATLDEETFQDLRSLGYIQ